MIVDVTVDGTVFKISCGDGKQSFKWLSTVVKVRIKESGLLRKRFQSENYVVTEIRNIENKLLNPSDKICDHYGPSGLNVTAIIANALPLDEWENPEYSQWMKGAFINSKVGNLWADEMEIWREKSKNNNKQLLSNSTTEHKHSFNDYKSEFIKIGFNFSDIDILNAFELDWEMMQWTFLNVSDKVIDQIGDILKINYSIICNIFVHFCGTGKVGERYGLSVFEFSHFIHFTGVYNTNKEFPNIEDIFFKTGNINQSLYNNKSKPNNYPLMTRSHFSQAIVYIALKEELGDSYTTSLTRMLEGPISVYWNNIISNYINYKSYKSDLKDLFLDYFPLLRKFFNSNANIHHKYGPSVNVDQLFELLVSNTILGDSQRELCFNCVKYMQLNPSPELELKDIVFCEFIDIISQIALILWDDHRDMSDKDKICIIFKGLTETQNHENTLNHK